MFSVSQIVSANQSLWCGVSVNTAVDKLKSIIHDRLGFLTNIFGEKKINKYVEIEAAKMFKCWNKCCYITHRFLVTKQIQYSFYLTFLLCFWQLILCQQSNESDSGDSHSYKWCHLMSELLSDIKSCWLTSSSSQFLYLLSSLEFLASDLVLLSEVIFKVCLPSKS